jgi:hypothetical protein
MSGISKMVKCEFCPKVMHARGLQGHMRMKHKLILKTITNTVTPVQASKEPAELNSGGDLSITQVIEQKKVYEKVEVKGAGSKVFKAGWSDWEWYYKKYPEKAKEDWDSFQAVVKRIGDVAWTAATVQHEYLQSMFENDKK